MKDKSVEKQTYREAVAYVGANGVRINALADVENSRREVRPIFSIFETLVRR